MIAAYPRLTLRQRRAGNILPLLLCAEMLALAADGPLLAAIGAVAEIAAAIAVLLLVPPPAMFWRRFAPVLALATLSTAWLASAAMPGAEWLVPRGWIAPDLLAGGVMRHVGGIAVIVGSAAAAWQPGTVRRSFDLWLWLCLALLGVGLVMNQVDPMRVWGYDKGFLAERFTGTFLNANAAGCLFGTLAVLGLGRLLAVFRLQLERPPLSVMIVAPVAVFAGIGGCAISASRTALAATLAAMLVLVACDRTLHRRLRRRPALLVPLLVLSVGAALAALIVVGDAVRDRFMTVSGDGIERLRIWRFYGDLVRRAPLGYGPGAIDDATLHALWDLRDARRIWFVHSPHDLVLNLLIVGGWPHLVLVAATAAMLLWRPLRENISSGEPTTRSALLALAVMGTSASVDITLDIPAFGALAAFLAASLWARTARQAAAGQSASASSAATRGSTGVPATSPVA